MIADQQTQRIAGYFSLAFKELLVAEECRQNLSNSRRRELFGSSSPRSIRAILLAQLGKDDVYGGSLDMENILSFANTLAKKAQTIIGGKLLLVECEDCEITENCKNNKKLVDIYRSHQFSYVQQSPETGLNQLVILI